MMEFTIQREKLAQVPGLLRDHQIDVWLTFVRETNMNPDPVMDLIVGVDMTWLSAFLLTRSGEHIAIVGRYDADAVKAMGGYSEVIGYDQDLFPDLLEVLDRLAPETIALNYSTSDVAADGLSYGLWLLLNRGLAATPYKHRLVSAEPLISALRGRKTPTEVARVRAAIRTTETIFQVITEQLKPGQSETQIAAMMQAEVAKRGLKTSWFPCPNVSAGPDSPVAHSPASDQYHSAVGQLLHMDFGIIQNEYVSDIQRVWYFARPGESTIPAPVQRAFDAVRAAILEAARVLKPGVEGWQVDEAARRSIVSAGYPEYQHAVGHHIGRSVHDGATVLGPRWARYGKTINGKVEAGNIFTLELGVAVPDYGFVGLEEDVLVKDHGLEWLSTPQTELIVITHD